MSRRRRSCVHAGVFHEMGMVSSISRRGQGTCSVAEELTGSPVGATLEWWLDWLIFTILPFPKAKSDYYHSNFFVSMLAECFFSKNTVQNRRSHIHTYTPSYERAHAYSLYEHLQKTASTYRVLRLMIINLESTIVRILYYHSISENLVWRPSLPTLACFRNSKNMKTFKEIWKKGSINIQFL